MHLGVSGVNELTGDKAVGDLLCKLISLCNSALHALCALGKNDLCTVSLKDISALNAHCLRHCENGSVALGSCDCGKADTCVAGSRLDDYGTGLEKTLFLSNFDHVLCDSVLNASCGIEIFKLNENLSLKTKFLFNVCNLNEGSLTDEFKCALINL